MSCHPYSTRRPCGPLRHRAAGWYLLVLLVLAPWLGMLHAVVHPAGMQVPQTHLAQPAADADGLHGPAHASAPAVLGQGADTGWVHRLFGPHGTDDCRVYDQLLHADALLPAAPLAVDRVWVAIRRTTVAAMPRAGCSSAVFEARAPPSAR